MREKQKKTQINGKKQTGFIGKALKVEHVFPDGQRLLFSNHMTVQHTNEGEFTISFFEVFQPVLIGDRDEIDEKAAAITSVPANCIARIVVSATRMPKLIGALITNYEAYEKDTGKSDDTSNGDGQENKKHAS